MAATNPTTSSSQDDPSLSELRFTVNQDGDCLAVARGSQLAVLATPPHAPPRRRTWLTHPHPLHAPAMLHKTNLLAFVSGTKRKRVVLHDDLKRRPVGSFDTAYPIARLILRRDAVVLLSTHALAVHLLRPPNQKVYELPLANTTLLAASCSWAPRFVVACETQQRGAVQVLDLTALVGNAASSAAAASPLPPPPSSSSATVGVLPSSAVRLIRAHDSPVAALAVSPDAARVATASGRGTLIRVWDAASGALVRELRRGVDAAAIQSLSFSSDAARLVVVSDKATVHVFNIGPPAPGAPSVAAAAAAGTSTISGDIHGGGGALRRTGSGDAVAMSANVRSHLSFLTPLLPSYFSSEWAFATCRVPVADDDPMSSTASAAGGTPSSSSSSSSTTSSSSTATTNAGGGPSPSAASSVAAALAGPAHHHHPVSPLTAWLVGDTDKVMVAAADGRLWRFALDRRRGGDAMLEGVWRIRWPRSDAVPIADPLVGAAAAGGGDPGDAVGGPYVEEL